MFLRICLNFIPIAGSAKMLNAYMSIFAMKLQVPIKYHFIIEVVISDSFDT